MGFAALLTVLTLGTEAFASVTAPRAATFYPRMALLTVEETVTPKELPGGMGFVLTLPGKALRPSFTLDLKGGEVAGIAWSDIVPINGEEANNTPLTPTMEQRKALLAKQTEVRRELSRIEALILVNKKRTEQLSDADDKLDEKKGVEELIRLDEFLARQLTALMTELPELNEKARELRKTAADLQRAIALLGEAPSLQNLTVTVNGASGPVTATYTYMMGDCGWTPAYTAQALPEKGSILFRQEADLYQTTGVRWENVAITVATNTPDGRITPGALPSWKLDVGAPAPQPAVNKLANTQYRRSQAVSESVMASAEMQEAAPAPAPRLAPVREERATFAMWHAGTRTIPAEGVSRVALGTETWKAEFYYTLRPMLDPRGFLTAAATPPKPVDIPKGPATFLVDGAPVGTGTLTLHGTDVKLYFGPDPLVTAEMRNDARTSGESGIISKDQTVTWNWTITVRNGRDKAATVRVEDPSPVSANEAITLSVTSQPTPERNNHAYSWRMDMKPGETKTITHTVKASAPKETSFRPGR